MAARCPRIPHGGRAPGTRWAGASQEDSSRLTVTMRMKAAAVAGWTCVSATRPGQGEAGLPRAKGSARLSALPYVPGLLTAGVPWSSRGFAGADGLSPLYRWETKAHSALLPESASGREGDLARPPEMQTSLHRPSSSGMVVGNRPGTDTSQTCPGTTRHRQPASGAAAPRSEWSTHVGVTGRDTIVERSPRRPGPGARRARDVARSCSCGVGGEPGFPGGRAGLRLSPECRGPTAGSTLSGAVGTPRRQRDFPRVGGASTQLGDGPHTDAERSVLGGGCVVQTEALK